MAEIPPEIYQQVSQKATRGMGWNYLSFGLRKILNLIGLAILAHLLTPGYFGLVALATTTMDYLSIFSDLGLGAAIIQRKHSIEESANVAFILNFLAGFLLTVVTFLISPLAASFFRNAEVTPVLRWLGLSFFLTSIGSVHNVLLQRDLDFKKRAIPDLGNSIVKAVVSIVLAITGMGVWALVIGQLAGTAVGSLLLWIVHPWKPRWRWNGGIARELFRYGVSIMGNNALSIWEDSFDYLVIGRIYSPALLGIYTIAYKLPQMLVINILWVMTAVIFPAFSSLQEDRESLKKLFLSIIRYMEIVLTPICLGMVVAADPITRVAFGGQWVAAIPVLRVLSLYALVISVGYHVGDIYKAIGRPDILVKLAVPIFLVRLVGLWIGAQFSILGVSIAHLIVSLVAFAVQMTVASRFIKIDLMDILRQLKAFIAGSVLVCFALPALYFTREVAPVLRLAIVVVAGAVGYLGALWFLERGTIMKALQVLRILRIPEGIELSD
jgi:lipopolysaccharide exporter